MRLALLPQHVVELPRPHGCDHRVDDADELVPGRDGDARFALLELYGLEAVADGEEDPPVGVGAPPGAKAALGLDRPLGAVLALDRATPGRRVAGVEGERLLLLQARDGAGLRNSFRTPARKIAALDSFSFASNFDGKGLTQMVASPPTFDASALIKLAERTEYESWLLEDVYALVEQELFPSFPDAVVYPVDKSKGQFFGVRAMNIDLGDWRPGFLNAGAPLIFVTTFKLLDMLIEWTWGSLDVSF